MFEQNNVGVRLENPLVAYAKSLTQSSPELGHVLAVVERIVASFEDGESFNQTAIALMWTTRIRAFIHLCIYSFIHSSIHPFIHSLTRMYV